MLSTGHRNRLIGPVQVVRAVGEDEIDPAGVAVHEGAEPLDRSAPHTVDQTLDQPAVQVADQVRSPFGQLAERAVGEGHAGDAVLGRHRRVEPKRGHAGLHRGEAAAPGEGGGVGLALVTTRVAGLLGPGAGRLGQREQHAGHHRERRRLEAEAGAVGRQRVAVLRPAGATPRVALDRQQADLAHALEVGPHRVRVQVEALGDVGGRQRRCRPGQLEVDGVAGVVAERLQDGQAVLRCHAAVHTTRLHGSRR